MAKLMISFFISFVIFGCGTFNTNSDSTIVASNQAFMSVKEKCKIDPNCFWRYSYLIVEN